MSSHSNDTKLLIFKWIVVGVCSLFSGIIIFILYNLIKIFCIQTGDISWRILNYSDKNKLFKKSRNQQSSLSVIEIQNRSDNEVDRVRYNNRNEEYDEDDQDNEEESISVSEILSEIESNPRYSSEKNELNQESGNNSINLEETYRKHYDQNHENNIQNLAVLYDFNKKNEQNPKKNQKSNNNLDSNKSTIIQAINSNFIRNNNRLKR